MFKRKVRILKFSKVQVSIRSTDFLVQIYLFLLEILNLKTYFNILYKNTLIYLKQLFSNIENFQELSSRTQYIFFLDIFTSFIPIS
jgi:hypothetical protein